MAINDLKGKQVLITGAGSGIGRAAALAFARRGAHIIASDIQLGTLESVKRDVETLGVSCMIHAVDVSNETAMKEFASLVLARSAPSMYWSTMPGLPILVCFWEVIWSTGRA